MSPNQIIIIIIIIIIRIGNSLIFYIDTHQIQRFVQLTTVKVHSRGHDVYSEFRFMVFDVHCYYYTLILGKISI